MMTEEEYQEGLRSLRRDWGTVFVDPTRRGFLLAGNDLTTGILVGYRAPLIKEIINRALSGRYDQR